MKVMFSELTPDVAHFTLKFPNDSYVTWSNEAVQPLRWFWSLSQDKNSPFIQWHADYSILSFGLLDEKALPESWIGFDVQPSDCPIKIGSQKTDLEIAYAFGNVTQSYLYPLNAKYANSYWCFVAEIPGVKDTFEYKLGIHFGYPVEITSYNCCYTYYEFTEERLNVNCSQRQSETMHDTTSGPYFMGLILFCYFPILLLSFASSISDTDKVRRDKCISKLNEYISIDSMEDADTDHFDNDPHIDFVYLEHTSPITSTSFLCGLCGLGHRFPRLASRLRRTLFIALCPIVIYIKLIIYNSLQKELTLELINHGVPINFLSMLGGYTKSLDLFVPLLGGPIIAIILFYAIAVLLVIIPENLEDILEDGSENFGWMDKCPFTLDLESIQGFSHTKIRNAHGFSRIRATMVGRFYCILNPKFWSHICCRSLARCRRCMSFVRVSLPRCIYYIVNLVLIPILVLIFSIELLIFLLYYGIPLPWFVFTAFTGWGKAWIRIFKDRLGMMTRFSSYCTTVLGYLVLVPVLCYFLYCTIMIFSTGFNFVAEIFVFIFIAVIVYPTTAFGYLFFGTALFYYVLKQLRGIGESYFELLSDVIEVMMVLKAEPEQFQVVDGTLIVPIERSSTIQAIQINGNVIQLSHKQMRQISSSSSQPSDCLIHYKNKVPGIPRDLYLYVVRTHRPVFLTVFKVCLRIGLIVLLLFGTLRITSYAPSTSSQVTEVMHVIFIVLIGSLPRALEVTFSGSNKVILKEIFLRQLESTIKKYKRHPLTETEM
ncbi:hypothetical protein ACJMK2_019376 [Sinanodonta woodiana]|uniref:Uncharacterized protein n=1 Tax=Sinanodonta woodiana TaxID=1069815 RepID=A0ABD3UGI8_SINWO